MYFFNCISHTHTDSLALVAVSSKCLMPNKSFCSSPLLLFVHLVKSRLIISTTLLFPLIVIRWGDRT